MKGLMQDWPLLISRLIEHADRFHGKTEVVSETVEGTRHRYSYSDCHLRTRKLAQALKKHGIKKGDRVATLAWNTFRHLELWYGVSGMGAVCHTVNPRLFPEQIAYILNHAKSRMLCFDLTFLPLVQKLKDHLESVEDFVLLTDKNNMPGDKDDGLICYEDFVEAEDGDYDWPELDENDAASLCYTSGTTGHPKGVLYSHRSTVLHAMIIATRDSFGLSSTRGAMPIVPMFHANAWGYPYGVMITGSRLILNGPKFEGKDILKLIKEENVHVTAGVPTIWLGLLKHLRESGKDLKPLEGLGIGGAAAPLSMVETFEKEYNVEVHHAWGMTETSPVGTQGSLNAETSQWSHDDQIKLKTKQGRGLFGVEMKIVDDDGKELPWDGETFGHLKVRGPWVASKYYHRNIKVCDEDGWFDTGDVATIDENGYMQITDRAKDVIKSGGEWISSIDLENAAMGHEDIAEAAVIGLPHPKWDERPLMIVVLEKGKKLDKDSILKFLKERVADWWLPNEIVEVDEMPHSATGKILKTKLREEFEDFKLPDRDKNPV